MNKVKINYIKGTEINDKSNKGTKSKTNKLQKMCLRCLFKDLKEKGSLILGQRQILISMKSVF